MKRFLVLLCTLWAGIAQATVTGTVTENTYACNGTQTAYPTTFRFLAGTDLAVTKTAAGITSALALTTDYTVTGAKAATGTVTLTAGSKCPAGSTLTITRTLPMTQGTAFRSQGSFSPALHEDAFDRLAMVDQQLSRDDGLARADIADLEAFVNGLAAGGQVVIPKTWTLAGDGTALTFALPNADLSGAASYYVTIDGLSQIPTQDFSVSGGADTITFTSAPPLGSVIEVRCLTYAKAQSVADATTITATGSTTARSLADRAAEVVNVKDFGCLGDGSSDDTACFQAAAATGRPLLVVATTAYYRVGAKISLTNSITGVGMPKILRTGATGQDAGVLFEIDNYGGNGLVISGLHLDGGWDQAGTAGEWSHLISIRGSDNITIEASRLERSYGDNIYIGSRAAAPTDNSTGIRVRGNVMRTPRRCNVAVVGGIGVWIEANDIGKDNNYVAAIDLEPNGNETVENVHVVNNKFAVPQNPFVLLAEILSNANPKHYVWVEGNVGTATRLLLKPVSTSPAPTGWEHVHVRGNTYLGHNLVSAKTIAALVEMQQDGTSTDKCKNVVIEGNTDLAGGVDTGPTTGWYLRGCENVTITGNVIAPTTPRRQGISTRGLKNATITGNIIRGIEAAASGGASFTMEDLAGVSYDTVTITGNYFGERLWVATNVANAVFTGNALNSASGHIRLESGTASYWQMFGNRTSGAGAKWSIGTGVKSQITDVGEVLTGTVTFDAASIAAGACAADQAVTVTGAVAGSDCMVGLPTTITAGVQGACRVSATNTVQLRLCNISASPSDPPSATYSVRVFNP